MTDLAQLRKELIARLEVLGHRVHDLEENLREPLEADFAEQAAQMEDDEVTAELEHTAIKEAEQIQAAIGRIDTDTYGECVSCGNEIDPKRLQVLPYATECIDCVSERS
jgi:RNA polymerase-binding transcription factor DksA